MKRIILCADDFAQSQPISEGILELVTADRLDAISCMTESPIWAGMAEKLKTINTSSQVGLHFNLTHDFNGNHLSLAELLKNSFTANLNARLIRSLFIRQWNAFEEHYGQPPEFVDGHQHVHAFPVIRQIVLEETTKRNPQAWVRLPASSTPCIKGMIIHAVTWGFEDAVRKIGLAFNPHFSGFRPYKYGFDFSRFFRNLLANSEDETLVMCHPGHAADDMEDPISPFRQAELDYLKSPALLADMQANEITRRKATDDRPFLRKGSPYPLFPA